MKLSALVIDSSRNTAETRDGEWDQSLAPCSAKCLSVSSCVLTQVVGGTPLVKKKRKGRLPTGSRMVIRG